MKKTLVVLVIFSAHMGSLGAQSAPGAKLEEKSGQVWVRPPGASEQQAQPGQDIQAGSGIRTGDDGKAAVTFTDGSHLTVQANSAVMLSAHLRKKVHKNSVIVFFGRVWSKVTRSVSGETNFEVNTPSAVCGVRGTEFETAVADDGTARVRVREGSVKVVGDKNEQLVGGGNQVDADDKNVGAASPEKAQPQWDDWNKDRRDHLKKSGRAVIDSVTARVNAKKAKLEALRAEEQRILEHRKSAEERAKSGDQAAINEIRADNARLAEITDTMADLGDAATSQFGFVDHLADLAADPRFGMVDRKYMEMEAKSLRRVKEMLDKMVKEGTDISIEGMDKMLDDMGKGKRGSLKEKNGSSVKDMFQDNELGNPENDMH